MKTAILRTLSPLAIAAAASSPAWAGDLTLYTALEAEEIEAYIAAAEGPCRTLSICSTPRRDVGAQLPPAEASAKAMKMRSKSKTGVL